MKYLCLLLIMLNIYTGIGLYNAITKEIEPDHNICGFSSLIEYQAFKRLHVYHGCLCSWVENGSCVYMRNGQICSLWDPLTRTDK